MGSQKDSSADQMDNSLVEAYGGYLDVSTSEEEFPLPSPRSKSLQYYSEEDAESAVRIVKPEVLQVEMEAEIKEAAELTFLPPTAVRVMLNAFKWDKAQLLEKTMYGESFLQLRDLGIIVNPVSQQPNNFPVVPSPGIGMAKHGGGTCLVCRRITNELSMVFTACDHWFCIRCLHKHLMSELKIGDRSHFQCPYVLCSMILEDKLVCRYLPPPLLDDYKKLCLDDFVNCNKFRRACPTEGCNLSAWYDVNLSSKFKEVRCECGSSYCFGCGHEWHYPLPCELLKKWLNIFDGVPEYEAIANFKFSSSSKPCPCCSTYNENAWRSENIMCSMCNYKFCWKCLDKPTAKHTCSVNMDLSNSFPTELAAFVQIQTDYVELSDGFSVGGVDKYAGLPLSPIAYEDKFMTNDEIFDIIGKSQRLLRYSLVYAYFMENTLGKLRYLELLFKLEKLIEVLVDNFGNGKDVIAKVEQLCGERDHLLNVLSQGTENDLWKIREVNRGIIDLTKSKGTRRAKWCT